MTIRLLFVFAFLSLPGYSGAQNSEAVFDALTKYESSFQGFRVEYEVIQGKYDLPEPKMLSEWKGVLIWDKKNQKQIEYLDTFFLPNEDQWEKGATFIGESFSVSQGASHDLEGSEQGLGFVKSNGESEFRPWWGNCAPGLITLNTEDNVFNKLSDVLREFDYEGSVTTSKQTTNYKFQSGRFGSYTIELDPEKRIVRIEITKMPSNQWKGNTTIDTPPFDSARLVVTIKEFDYDEEGVCIGWRRVAEYWPKKAGKKHQELEWRYRAISVSKIDELNSDKIKFETMSIAEGSRFSAQDDPGVEYIWSDNQIVRVVDSSTLQTINGADFVPAKNTSTRFVWFGLIVICIFVIVTGYLWNKSK